MTRATAFVVCADEPDGRLYLDDTGTGVRDAAQAKRFASWAEAQAGVVIAHLAPAGGDAGDWRIEPVSRA